MTAPVPACPQCARPVTVADCGTTHWYECPEHGAVVPLLPVRLPDPPPLCVDPGFCPRECDGDPRCTACLGGREGEE